MKNKIKYVIIPLFILLFLFVTFYSYSKKEKEKLLGDTVGTNIYALNDAGEICSEINKMTNSTLKIGITTPYEYKGNETEGTTYVGGTSTYKSNKTFDVIISESAVSSCSNSKYPTAGYEGEGLTNITKAEIEENGYKYKSWARFAKVSNKYVYVEDVKVKEPGSQPDRYSYLEVQNRDVGYTGEDTDSPTERKLKSYYTLKPGERIFFDIDLSSYSTSLNNSKDLRVTVNFGKAKDDIKINNQNSITYYLYDTNNSVYGPFEMSYSNLVNEYSIYKSGTMEFEDSIVEYSIVSENLLQNVSSNIQIKKIRFYPYGNYKENKYTFKLYSLSVDLYDNEYQGKEYVNVTDAEDRIRHNIVNNMMAMATLKWSGANTHRYYIYYADGRGPFEVSSNEILYGIPYVGMRMSRSTLYSFLANTRKDYVDGKVINIYKTGQIYWRNGVSSKGRIIKEGAKRPYNVYIINDNFSLYAGGTLDSDGTWYVGGATTDAANSVISKFGLEGLEIINNEEGAYLQGISCSSSAGASYGPEVPYKAYISAANYLESSQVELVGGMKLTMKEVNDIITVLHEAKDVKVGYSTFYTSVVQSKYGLDGIFDAYAKTLPGDLIAHPGHVELLTGRTHVECYGGKKTDNSHGEYYTDGFCDGQCNSDHTKCGIDPTKSYVVKTTLGGSNYEWKGSSTAIDDAAYVQNGDAGDDDNGDDDGGTSQSSGNFGYVLTNDSGWSYELNPKYTDLTSIDQIYTDQNVKAGIGVNVKRTFSDMLYGSSDTSGDLKTLMASAENLRTSVEEGTGGLYTLNYQGNRYVLYSTSAYKYKMYLPYRLKGFNKIINNKIEKPTVKYILDKEYTEEEQNTLLFNYLKDNHTLKGMFSVNYMINGIKVEINGKIPNDQNQIVSYNKTFYMYPDQKQEVSFSLANDFSDEIKDALNNLVYDESFKIVVSFNMGPNLEEVKNEVNADSEGYFKVLTVQTPDTITITEKEVTYDGNIQEANVTSLSGNISSITYYNNDTCTNEVSPVNPEIYYVIVSTSGNNTYGPVTSECTKAIIINKGTGTITVTNDNVSLSRYNNSVINYSYNGDSTVTCDVSNNAIVDCTIDSVNNRITITSKIEGSTDVTLSAQESNNYLATSKLINVNVEYNRYTVTFNTTGGSNILDQSIVEGEKVTIPSNPTRDGYTFAGWKLNGNSYNFDTPITGNITLVAEWEENVPNRYVVTFNSTGGSSVASQIIDYNGKVTKPNNPTRSGYTFKKWLLNGSEYDFNNAITSNITLTAEWQQNETIQKVTLKELLQDNGYGTTNNYASKFKIGDSISTIKSKLGSDVTIESKTSIISTGTVIKKGNESYTVVVKGDLNGDGKSNSGDLLQMRKYLLEEISLTGAYKQAGIIESNNEIKSLDLLRLRQYLLGEYIFK